MITVYAIHFKPSNHVNAAFFSLICEDTNMNCSKLSYEKVLSVIDMDRLIGYQATHTSLAIFSETKLTSLVTHWFSITSKLPRWLLCILHCSFTFIFALPKGWVS